MLKDKLMDITRMARVVSLSPRLGTGTFIRQREIANVGFLRERQRRAPRTRRLIVLGFFCAAFEGKSWARVMRLTEKDFVDPVTGFSIANLNERSKKVVAMCGRLGLKVVLIQEEEKLYLASCWDD